MIDWSDPRTARELRAIIEPFVRDSIAAERAWERRATITAVDVDDDGTKRATVEYAGAEGAVSPGWVLPRDRPATVGKDVRLTRTPDGDRRAEPLEETAATGSAAVHPDLATHDAMGLATDAELATHAAAADPHSVYAFDSDLLTHATAQKVHAYDALTGLTAGALVYGSTSGPTQPAMALGLGSAGKMLRVGPSAAPVWGDGTPSAFAAFELTAAPAINLTDSTMPMRGNAGTANWAARPPAPSGRIIGVGWRTNAMAAGASISLRPVIAAAAAGTIATVTSAALNGYADAPAGWTFTDGQFLGMNYSTNGTAVGGTFSGLTVVLYVIFDVR